MSLTLPRLSSLLVIATAFAVAGCGKKADLSPQTITLQMTSADTRLSLTEMSEATMGIGGCDSGLKKKSRGASRQTLELPQGETGCYGYLASFTLAGDTYVSDDMTPGTFAEGRSVHFFSKAAGKLMKVTTVAQLAHKDNNGKTVSFALKKARYLKYFPYNRLPIAGVSHLGPGSGKLPIRVDGFAYRGLTATGAPKFELALSCLGGSSAKGEANGEAKRCTELQMAKLRFAVISHSAPQDSLAKLEDTWARLEPSLMPEAPSAVIGRRLLFKSEAFAADGLKARIAGSRQYVLVFAYEGRYELQRFPLPTISYLRQPSGVHKRF